MSTETPAITPEQNKAFNKGCLILIGLFIGIVTLISICTPDPVSEQTSFADAPDKNEWLLDYRTQNEGNMQIALEERIRNQFKFSPEVEFENRLALVKDAHVRDAETGEYFTQGHLTAPNAFNVRSRYYFEASFIMTDAEQRILSVKVYEH